MKRTQVIDLLTTIRGSIVSFFAITMFVALGAGLFLGIHWIAGGMHSMAAEQFAKGSAHDIEITFPYGLTEYDREQLDALDPDDLDIEASYLSFQEMPQGDRNIVFRVGTLPKSIDTFIEVEGTLPKKENEIALERSSADRLELGVGDTVSFLHDDPDGTGMLFLHEDTFTITAIVLSPAYLAKSSGTYGASTVGSGSTDAISWVAEDAFSKAFYLGGKPYVLIKSKRLAQMDPFSDEYKEASRELEAKVSALGESLGGKRMEAIRNLRQFVNSQGIEMFPTWETTYAGVVARHEAGVIDDATYKAEMDALYEDIRQTFAEEGVDFDEVLELLGINPAGLEGEQGMATIGALALVATPLYGDESSTLFTEIRDVFSSMADYAWIVLSRTYNGAIILMESFCGVTANLRWSMASLFLIVGLLVCYSAVSRLVHEQVSRIGTKKALGFRKQEISRLFLGYSALCVVLGMVVGVLVAVFVVEKILLGFIAIRFVKPVVLYASARDILLIGALEMVLILASTWLAVSGVLKRQAVELLAGERPNTARGRFYERWGIWKRMGLLGQTTINNCINDTRRVVGTLVGVAGCTALIVCAVMLNDNVMRSFERQYEAITHYQAIASVKAGSEASELGVQDLTAAGMGATPVLRRSFTLRFPDGGMSVATVTVPLDEEGFAEAMTLIPVGEWSDEEGVYVSEAYREHFGAKVGDVITLVDAAGNKSELPIAGFFEWHMLSHQIVVPKALYERSFNEMALANALLVDMNGESVINVDATLMPLDGYVSTRNDYVSNRAGFDEFSSIAKIVVAVYLALAAVMAACVLLNLDFMFVDEKKRELIVLMINGYGLKDAKGYIWHDSVALTALGIICGMLLGSAVGGFTIRSIEQQNSSFIHGVSPLALAAGVVGTIVLASAALLIALRRIKRFALTDINRF